MKKPLVMFDGTQFILKYARENQLEFLAENENFSFQCTRKEGRKTSANASLKV